MTHQVGNHAAEEQDVVTKVSTHENREGDREGDVGGATNNAVVNVSVVSVTETADSLKKLNLLAAEFVPSSHTTDIGSDPSAKEDASPSAMGSTAISVASSSTKRRWRRQRERYRKNVPRPQNQETLRRTVYISNIDNEVSEERLAEVFMECGQVVDCRVRGDHDSSIGLNLAFLEFVEQKAAEKARSLAGTVLGRYSICVEPSKTAIVPVNEALLPRSENERERCSRTIHCSNIDKAMSVHLISFFEYYCGKVAGWTILDNHHSPSTQAAIVEFITPVSAVEALNWSGYCFGSSRIRVSPSKTPIRFSRSDI